MTKTNFHEQLGHGEELVVGSNRKFGLVIGGILTLIAALALYKGAVLRGVCFGVPGVALITAALLCAEKLTQLNRLWMRLGLVLHIVVSPIIMLLLFVFSIIPIGLLMRAFSNDPLRRKFEPEATSYWIERPAQTLSLQLLRRQF